MIDTNDMSTDKPVVGRMAYVNFYDDPVKKVRAKIDTGADTSSVWASNVRVDENNLLHFTLFGEGSEHYTGNVITKDHFRVTAVRSSSGHQQIRYTVQLKVKVDEKTVRGTFTLTDRSRNLFPILIGSRTLLNKFIVDVSHGYEAYRHLVKELKNNRDLSGKYSEQSRQDPYAFYQQQYLKQFEGDA